MKTILIYNATKRFAVLVFAILAVGATSYFVLTANAKPDAPDSTASAARASYQKDSSRFSFSGAPDWRKGPSNATSMALFHADGCFVSTEYKAGKVDVAVALEKIRSDLVNMGYEVAPVDTVKSALKANGQTEHFQLHQNSVTGTGTGGDAKGGQEFGYMQLSAGYVEVKGFCDTAVQLSTTIEALQAVTFN